MSTQNKFSDNSKSPIFTQNYLLQITISLAKSNNLRSPLKVKPSHNKFNLYTIPNNSLHLNPVISQIPLSHLPKTQQSLPMKSTHHSPISTKIITQNTYLEVHNLPSPENTHLNCVKFSYNSIQQFYTWFHINLLIKQRNNISPYDCVRSIHIT